MRPRLSWGSAGLVVVLVALVSLWATGRLELHWRPESRADAKHEGEGHKEEEEEQGRVKGDKAILDAEALKAAGLRSEPVAQGSVAVALEASGEIQVPDERIAHVTPRVTGVVRNVYKARGELVVAGAPLAMIESAELGDVGAAVDAATTDLKLAEANVAAWRRRAPGGSSTPPVAVGWPDLDQALAEQSAAFTEKGVAERAYARLKELYERGLRSRTELLVAEAEVARAQARAEAAARRIDMLGSVADNELLRVRQRLEAAQAKLRALGGESSAEARREGARLVIRSPLNGVVTARDLTVGQTVEATAKVFSIADLSEVWVTAALYDKDIAAVRQGQPATARVQSLGDAVFTGRVIQIGPQIDEKTRTMPVRVAIANRAGANGVALRPGMFATVALETARRANVLVVPVVAVQTLEGQPVVFVETASTEGAAFQRRPVKTGARDDQMVEVLEGLTAGERVVVNNAFLLKSEFERAKIGGGHGH